jgi:hypothetical protein
MGTERNPHRKIGKCAQYRNYVSSIEKFQAANTNMWDGSTMAPPRLDPICLPELTTELFSLHLVVPEVVSFCPPQKKPAQEMQEQNVSKLCYM